MVETKRTNLKIGGIHPEPHLHSDHLISAEQLTSERLENRLFPLSDILEVEIGLGPKHRTLQYLTEDDAVLTFSEEPTTRTGLSMHRAAEILGARSTLVLNAGEATSLAKLESRLATRMMFEQYGFRLVGWRTSEEDGLLEAATPDAQITIINLGDGPGEHPTQYLLDLRTMREIRKEQQKSLRTDWKIVVSGNPGLYRTIRSWFRGLAVYCSNLTLRFVCPEELRPREEDYSFLKERDVNIEEVQDLKEAVIGADFVCGSRYPVNHDPRFKEIPDLNERIRVAEDYYGLRRTYLTEEVLDAMPSHARYLHPLPNGPELPDVFIKHPKVLAYTHQPKNGLITRMALILDYLAPEVADQLLKSHSFGNVEMPVIESRHSRLESNLK